MIAGVTFLGAGVTGCVTNPVSGASQLALVSEARLIAQSEIDYRREIDKLRKGGHLIERGADFARLQAVTGRLVTQAVALRPGSERWKWEVHLVNAPGIYNAWCMPGGKMVMYSGFMTRLKMTDDELAQIMAHEVSHALLSHGLEGKSIGMLSQVVNIAAAASGIAPLGTDLATSVVVTLPASRANEAEADELGIELAARAGFDPAGATAVMAKFLAVGGATTSRSDFWNSHPATVKRIEALARLRAGMEPIYLAARSAAAVHVPDANASPAGAEPVVDDGCGDLDSRVDQAECRGQLRLGMSHAEVHAAVGAPDESRNDGRALRYGDRSLEFDARGRLVRIGGPAGP